MTFCPLAKGPCPGRDKCPLWIRGRIISTDTKQLAISLARYFLQHNSSNPKRSNLKGIPSEIATSFWEKEGIPNISQACIRDRYLNQKVLEVEALVKKILSSSKFRATNVT